MFIRWTCWTARNLSTKPAGTGPVAYGLPASSHPTFRRTYSGRYQSARNDSLSSNVSSSWYVYALRSS